MVNIENKTARVHVFAMHGRVSENELLIRSFKVPPSQRNLEISLDDQRAG